MKIFTVFAMIVLLAALTACRPESEGGSLPVNHPSESAMVESAPVTVTPDLTDAQLANFVARAADEVPALTGSKAERSPLRFYTINQYRLRPGGIVPGAEPVEYVVPLARNGRLVGEFSVFITPDGLSMGEVLDNPWKSRAALKGIQMFSEESSVTLISGGWVSAVGRINDGPAVVLLWSQGGVADASSNRGADFGANELATAHVYSGTDAVRVLKMVYPAWVKPGGDQDD